MIGKRTLCEHAQRALERFDGTTESCQLDVVERSHVVGSTERALGLDEHPDHRDDRPLAIVEGAREQAAMLSPDGTFDLRQDPPRRVAVPAG